MRTVFPLLVLIAATLGLIFPAMFTWAVPLIVPLLGVAMFGMGMTLSPEDFKVVVKAPRIVFIGLIAQYIIMAGLAWVIVKVLRLPPEIAIGVILVGTCPGGTASNLMAYIAKADVALSVAMTACSTLISPLATPALTLLLAGQWLDVNAWGMLFSIVKIVIGPVLLGMLVHRYSGKFSGKIAKYVPLVSMTAIIIIIGAVVAINATRLMSVAAVIVAAVVIHNLLGLSLGYLTGKMFKFPQKQSRTLALEIGLQNSGLAATLAKIHFASMPEAMLPAAIFSVWHNISGAVLAGYWSGKKPKDKPEEIIDPEPEPSS